MYIGFSNFVFCLFVFFWGGGGRDWAFGREDFPSPSLCIGPCMYLCMYNGGSPEFLTLTLIYIMYM